MSAQEELAQTMAVQLGTALYKNGKDTRVTRSFRALKRRAYPVLVEDDSPDDSADDVAGSGGED